MYGCEVNYKIELMTPGDKEKLQVFSCGNKQLDHYIKEEAFQEQYFYDGDGRHYKVTCVDTNEIIGFISIAASGIVHKESNEYMELLPAVKIDVIAVDLKYQKMFFDEESMSEGDHYYLSDDILNTMIGMIREINDQLLIKYILLYADKDKVHFYKRNMFSEFERFMEAENKQEISKNIPMYSVL